MSEELQRYARKINNKTIYRGVKLNSFEYYILGNTTLAQLKRAKIIDGFINDISFKPHIWKGKPTSTSRPDEIVLDGKSVILVVERKSSTELRTMKQEEEAAEQCLVYMQQLNAKLGIVTDYSKFLWITDPNNKSIEVRYIYEGEALFSEDYRKSKTITKVLTKLDTKTDSLIQPPALDPTSLAVSVWQTLWHATHEEPKLCLATFVELFLYKFLSDLEVIPKKLRIYQLDMEEKEFISQYGKTQIEYYCQHVRKVMKSLFPEKSSFSSPISNFKFGSDTTSIIDGFAFLEPGITNHNHPLSTFNSPFMSIIKAFINFPKITRIDSEFKSRVYEKFLKKSEKQQKLGQFLTPRNIIRTILGMANPRKLMRHKDTSICDPACGVGGFLLEPLLHKNLLEGNLEVNESKIKWKVELVGLEVDRQTNILAKANMLIHLAEIYRELTKKQQKSFVDMMNKTFLLTDHIKMLGALEFPQDNRFDLILTNPPFVVKGSAVIKAQIAESEELKDRYSQCGIGIESLFLRYVIDALKPGGCGFVIVPTGILTRTETAVRNYLLKNCILDGIVSLPEGTFYNTPNPTYILCFTKKMDVNQKQDKKVFAYLVREIGETRDYLRLPCRTDLKDLVRQFRAFYADKEVFEPRNLNCKIIPDEKLKAEDRWDVDRFWSDKEKIELGLKDVNAINIKQFETEFDSISQAIKADLDILYNEKETEIKYTEIPLSDQNYFLIWQNNFSAV